MAPNPRVVNAFNAMKKLGISEDVVKPVLKKLLRVFEKNWEPIEEENYRALADAVFEYQEANAAVHKGKPDNSNEEEEQAQLYDEPERPLKRTRRPQVGQGTSFKSHNETVASGSSLQITDTETGGAPENSILEHSDKDCTSLFDATSPGNKPHSVGAAKVSSNQSSALTLLAEREKNIASHPVIKSGAQMYENAIKAIQANSNSSPHLKVKGKTTVCEVPSKKNIPTSKRPSQSICLKEPKVEPGITSDLDTSMPKAPAPVKQSFVGCATDFSLSDVHSPSAYSDLQPHVDSSNDNRPARNDGDYRTAASPCLVRENNEPGVPSDSDLRSFAGYKDTPMVSSFDLESASSPLGEVRISLSCTVPCQSDFRMPSVDAVLKLAEEKCVTTYNVVSSFSLKRVIKDVCDSFLELGSKPKESYVPSHTHNPSSTKIFGNDTCNPANSKIDPSQSGETVHLNMKGNDYPRVNNLANSRDEADKGVELNGHGNDAEHNLAMVVADGLMSIYLADLSDGEERVGISLVNEINSVCRPSFKYMAYSVAYENASLDISLARIGDEDCCKACIGDCLTTMDSCACTSRAVGNFAYTSGELLEVNFLESYERVFRNNLKFCPVSCPLIRSGNDDPPVPCKGHVARNFIKECWRKCGCNQMCGNRVIQRGITRNLQVFMTPDGKGWGLRTLEDLPKGAFVCEYVGEILTLKELRNRYTQGVSSVAYPVLLDAAWGSKEMLNDERAICLDGTNYGNVARFINHRCSDSNLIDIPVEVESPDHLYYRVALFTRRKVNALEELTWDYGIDFERDCCPIKTFECLCGSKYCRGNEKQ